MVCRVVAGHFAPLAVSGNPKVVGCFSLLLGRFGSDELRLMAGALDFGAGCFAAGGDVTGAEIACEVCCSGIGALGVVVSGCCAAEMLDIDLLVVAEELDFDVGDFDTVVLDNIAAGFDCIGTIVGDTVVLGVMAAGFGCIGTIAGDTVVLDDTVAGFGCIGTIVVGLNVPDNLVTAFAGLLRGIAAGFGCVGTVVGNWGPFGGLNVSDNLVTAFAGFRNRRI